ncbi:NUDIX domain-containing protein [Lacticaseibacillus hulanensis]|uniref:NUDIX domain-containing protein n=1 Tax=Lacticaseibacillus hulanensis TaxID=2493111 RepID=UPI000FDA9D4B|nr:NUDIX domain-containing protein [Lacticaseibacillus hulanensis]
MVKKYTLVSMLTPLGVVAINRRKPPFRGMWNLIGGKVEKGETLLACAARETHEETGVLLPEYRFTSLGVLDWYVDGELVGLIYLYSAKVGDELGLPRVTREGLLASVDPSWLSAPDNQGAVPDARAVLPAMLSGRSNLHLVARYTGDELTQFEEL